MSAEPLFSSTKGPSMRRAKLWSIIAGTTLGVTLAAGAAAYHVVGQPMYAVGDAAAQLAASSALPTASDPHAPWQVADGIALHHFAAGAGEPVLVVLGGPCASPREPWRAAAELGGEFQLAFYHQRGCGASTRPIVRPKGGS